MVAPLTEFDQDQPILQETAVVSKAAGENAIGQALGGAAKMALQKGAELEDTESKAMYLQSAGMMQQLKTSTQQKILENPGQAKQIANNADQTADTIKTNSYVNTEDRAKLNYFVDRNMDEVNLRATEAAVEQRRLGIATNFYTGFPDQLKAYQDALIKGDDTADDLHQALIGTIRGAISLRAISPEQGSNSIKAIQGAVQAAHDYHLMYGNQDVSAQDYHTVASNPLNTMNVIGNGPAPIDGNTQWLTDYYTADRSAQNVFADINKGVLPNPEAFLSLKPAGREKAILMMQGTQKAQGMINSGYSFPALLKARDDLVQPGKVLNYQDQATRNALEIYVGDLKAGNFMDLMSRTPDGGQIMQKYLSQKSAVNEFADPATQDQLQRNNDNALISNAVAWGQGRHLPSTFIKPFPDTVLANVENGFQAGQDPQPIFDAMAHYDKDNHAYLANSLKDPVHQIVFNTISLAGNTVRPEDARAYVIGNQGQSFSALDLGKDGKTETELRTQVAVGLKDTLNYMLKQNSPEQATKIYSALIQSGVNMAKQLAIQNNDPQMNKSAWFGSSSPYTAKAIDLIQKAYNLKSGGNYIYNQNQANFSSDQFQILANYAANQGYEKLKEGASSTEYQLARDRNPLSVTLSPTNDLMATGQDGNVYFSTPITSSLLSHAQGLQDQENKKNERFGADIVKKWDSMTHTDTGTNTLIPESK